MQRETEQPAAHSMLGPSTCERTWHCPGWIPLSANAPAGAASEYAAEGTLAHQIAAEKLRVHFHGHALELYNHSLGAKKYVTKDESSTVYDHKPKGVDCFTFKVDQEMLDAVDTYVDFVIAEAAKYKLPKGCVFIEHRVKFDTGLNYRAGLEPFGTADCIIYVPMNKLVVIDYKHGAGTRVDVEGNKQLLSYGYGALCSVLEPDEVEELSHVEIVVVQPRGVGEGITRSRVEMEYLLDEFHSGLRDSHKRVLDGDDFRNPGDWCKFCPAKFICPERQQESLALAHADYEDLHLPALATWTPEMVAEFLNKEAIVKQVFSDIHELAKQHMKAGVVIPGWALKPNYGHAQWIDEEEATKKLNEFVDPYVKKVITPAEAKRRLKAAKKKGIDVDALHIDDLTTRKISSEALVRDTGKLEETIDADFALITVEE